MKNLYLITLLSLFMVNASYADENACSSGDQGGTGTDNDSCEDSTASEGDEDEITQTADDVAKDVDSWT